MMLFMLFILALLFSFQSLFCRLYTSARNGEGAVQFSVRWRSTAFLTLRPALPYFWVLSTL